MGVLVEPDRVRAASDRVGLKGLPSSQVARAGIDAFLTCDSVERDAAALPNAIVICKGCCGGVSEALNAAERSGQRVTLASQGVPKPLDATVAIKFIENTTIFVPDMLCGIDFSNLRAALAASISGPRFIQLTWRLSVMADAEVGVPLALILMLLQEQPTEVHAAGVCTSGSHVADVSGYTALTTTLKFGSGALARVDILVDNCSDACAQCLEVRSGTGNVCVDFGASRGGGVQLMQCQVNVPSDVQPAAHAIPGCCICTGDVAGMVTAVLRSAGGAGVVAFEGSAGAAPAALKGASDVDGVLAQVDCAAEFMELGRLRGNAYGVGYRVYEGVADVGRACVEENYRLNHMYQTYDFVTKMHAKHLRFDKAVLGVWEAIELLNEVVDDSDPDTALPQIEHLLQTAEAIREAYPQEDWFHLTGLLHDVGKVLAHPAFGQEPQWAVVGDTYPVGCAHDQRVVYHHHFSHNPDTYDPRYNTLCGVYSPGCGLDAVHMSFGHDEYGYRVLQHNGCTLPPQALYVIRYHSFYALHQHDAYAHLLDEHDHAMLPWLKAFQRFDLYSKVDTPMDVPRLKEYYMGLIHKYFPRYELQW